MAEEHATSPPGGWPDHVLPYGVVVRDGRPPRAAVAVGDDVVDLAGLARAGHLDAALPDPVGTLDHPTLDRFLAAGPAAWRGLRERLHRLVAAGTTDAHRTPAAQATTVLPWTVTDYVDLYSSREHATNVGRIFRPEQPALPDAWDHLPIGYHGRAGSVVVSGTEIVRPRGLHRVAGDVVDGPEPHLDVEVELGWVVGAPVPRGRRLPTAAFADHVLGAVLVDDWSARAVQAFETRPLGPFLGKAFATSVSAWIVPLAALDRAWVDPPPPPHPPTGYLAPAGRGLDARLQLALRPAGGVETVLSRPRAARLRWTPAQQLAHLAATGGGLPAGTLYASGTVSGPTDDEHGCLLERSWGWSRPVPLDGGDDRGTGLVDGDTVTIRGHVPGPDGTAVPLGEVVGTITPAGPA